MKATELIELLAQAIRNHGDLNVSMTTIHGDSESEFNQYVNSIAYNKTNNEIEIL